MSGWPCISQMKKSGAEKPTRRQKDICIHQIHWQAHHAVSCVSKWPNDKLTAQVWTFNKHHWTDLVFLPPFSLHITKRISPQNLEDVCEVKSHCSHRGGHQMLSTIAISDFSGIFPGPEGFPHVDVLAHVQDLTAPSNLPGADPPPLPAKRRQAGSPLCFHDVQYIGTTWHNNRGQGLLSFRILLKGGCPPIFEGPSKSWI